MSCGTTTTHTLQYHRVVDKAWPGALAEYGTGEWVSCRLHRSFCQLERSVPPGGRRSDDGEFSQIPRRAGDQLATWRLDDDPASWKLEHRYGSPGTAYGMFHVPLVLARDYLSEVPPAIRAGTPTVRPGDSGRQSKDYSRVSAVRILKLAVVRVCIEQCACGVSAVAVCR